MPVWECLATCLSPITGPVSEYLMKHLYYIIQVDDHVKSLNREVEVLEAKQKDVEEKIQKDEAAMKKPTNEVEGWLKRVKDVKPKLESVTTEYQNRNCMFLDTNCSFNCFSNHSISMRLVEDLLPTIKREMEIVTGVAEFTVNVLPPTVQQVSTTPLLTASGGEIESKLVVALNFLRDDAQGMLGIWGMGGVGKTTLLKQINNALATDGSFGFDRVVLVTASRECTVEKIRKLIAKELRLPVDGNHCNDILNYLNHKSFVILLDDVWEPLNLEQIGIPLPFGVVDDQLKFKRKLILASRSQKVCHKMDVVKTIKVECLSREAARLLFREKVGTEVINSHPHMLELVDKVADQCDGLPQALITIGRAMAGVPDVKVWKNAISQLHKSKTHEITGTDDDPLPLLKFSYDYLKDEKKQECFLLCALWPEDYKIWKDDLIECWIGHGLLDDFDDIEEAYNKGHAIIDSLQQACLLEHVQADKYELSNDHVKLHDLIRDMALWIARDCGKNDKKWVVVAGTGC